MAERQCLLPLCRAVFLPAALLAAPAVHVYNNTWPWKDERQCFQSFQKKTPAGSTLT